MGVSVSVMRKLLVLLGILVIAGTAHAQDGAALYRTYCAICHEGPTADAQAPSREVMKRLTAERVLESLERGSMRARAAERSRAQRRALAEFVSDKHLVADSNASIPKAAFCSETPALTAKPLAGPRWNGW